ncbi:glutathionylspermidine synthase family protein [Paenibacillus sp. YPG26]|uniref:glutathionylspermidine synthase family protein n=1 Tax=Paenibacillus sp. YPG26 TaxID=2878915 RepID=UPI00203B7013|nr:glutathionylspermidine synthase family protein [Paenibacillus sp. YPG26]USB31883.1 glutathionylspermidine synthase family protein [Paenibacillus sp. YPG26]
MREIYTPQVDYEEVFDGEIAREIPYYRMYGKQYCLPSFVMYKEHEITELRTASEQVNRIYGKALRFAQQYLPDSYLIDQLGLEPAMIPAARIPLPWSGIERQDWIIGEHGMKCIENNTETPTGIPEAAYLERELVRRCMDASGPSAHMDEALTWTFKDMVADYSARGLGNKVTFTCMGEILEDSMNTKYLMRRCKEAGIEVNYVPLEELRIVPGVGLYHGTERITILYRLYPLEFLIHDREEGSGVLVGEELMKLAAEGKLALINPAQNIITQSKGFMATIWSLYERNELTEEYLGFKLFDAEDMEIISKYLLPTYFTNEPFLLTGEPYAAKGYWGREGKGTDLYDLKGLEISRLSSDTAGTPEDTSPEEADYYDSMPKIYQRLYPMSPAVVPTELGDYHGYLLTGVYVFNGTSAGVLSRIGAKVTGDLAYYCPAAISSCESN